MAKFVRKIPNIKELKNQLNSEAFLKTVNRTMIQSGKALLAFRNGNATVYYEGRQLCDIPHKAYKGASATYLPKIYNHYLPLVRSKTLNNAIKKSNYLESEYLKETNGKYDFTSVLPEILDNMDKERDKEAYQVSAFYKFSPMLPQNDSDIVLLDIEAVFAQAGEKTDRIDVVLYNTIEKQLMFVEVKRLTDSRLYSNPKTNAPAEILDQLNRYKKRLKQEKDKVVEAYNNVISYYNELSASTRKLPLMDLETAKEPLLGLLVVDCTNAERFGGANTSDKFKALCTAVVDNKIKMYTYGSLKNANPNTLLKMYKTFK